jgi:hypothetical protein
MREYLAKIRIPEELKNESTGFIGEKIFELWFTYNYQDEPLFKQKADMDLNGVDFADSQGTTYQVKTTKAKTKAKKETESSSDVSLDPASAARSGEWE